MLRRTKYNVLKYGYYLNLSLNTQNLCHDGSKLLIFRNSRKAMCIPKSAHSGLPDGWSRIRLLEIANNLKIRNPGKFKWLSLFNCFCLKSSAFDPATPETTGTPGFPVYFYIILRGLKVWSVCSSGCRCRCRCRQSSPHSTPGLKLPSTWLWGVAADAELNWMGEMWESWIQ